VPNPKQAIRANETLRLKASAIKPIIGGPNKNPKKPIEETEAIATPGNIVFDFPARLYIMGTTDETPNPTNKNPIVAVMICGKITASIIPVRIIIPLNLMIL